METIPIRCERIERATYPGTDHMSFRVTFRVGTDREYFDVPIWTDDDSVLEEHVLELAQLTFHELVTQLSQQTIAWARLA